VGQNKNVSISLGPNCFLSETPPLPSVDICLVAACTYVRTVLHGRCYVTFPSLASLFTVVVMPLNHSAETSKNLFIRMAFTSEEVSDVLYKSDT
jgi:hypothetical protein